MARPPARSWLRAIVVGAIASIVMAPPARAQTSEVIHRYFIVVEIQPDGALLVTETIDYDFGLTARHGIYRDVPTRFRFDEVNDRVYPLEVLSVNVTDASADYEVTQEFDTTRIRIGDPDVAVTGSHTYTIVYRVRGALNPFIDHDELYWNAIGEEWPVPIEQARVTVRAPADISRALCFQGYEGSTEQCRRASIDGHTAVFVPSRVLQAYEELTFVVALPKGAVEPQPSYILEERWAVERAFSVNPWTVGVTLLLAAALAVLLAGLYWSVGRDRRFVGSVVDQVMGNRGGAVEPVPLGEGDAEAPVEFAPPEGLRPGQVGTLIDERANVVDVTATIVDLAVRGHLVIHEIPKEGWFGKPDWRLLRLEQEDDELADYERRLLEAIFRDGNEVLVSSLKDSFAERLHTVEHALLTDAVQRGWFEERPDKIVGRWALRGVVVLVVGVGITYVLARWTHWGLVGVPVIVAGLVVLVMAGRMPARTAKGTGLVRRIRGFRRVIETADTHMARWAEQENVFPTVLPFAIVFGLTDKWAKAFAALGQQPDTSSWYVGSQAFTFDSFSRSIDGFAVTAGGTLASTPSSSGSSGFGGGGSSGGGGGGGGGGSW